MGLLQKATEQKTHTPTIRENKFPEIKENLSKIKSRIEFYPTLFKELSQFFAIDKGALLIRDGEMFSLSAIIGYDETTKNRLRMNSDELNQFLQSGDNKILERYFSIREFVTIDTIQVIPFENESKIEGLLLVTEYKTQKEPEIAEIELYTKKLAPLFGENPLNKLKNAEVQSNDIKESITAYLQKIKNEDNRVLLLKLNIDSLISVIMDRNNLSTGDSIKNSAIKILSSFTKNRGKVIRLYNNDLLITILDKNSTINMTVVQQQITSAFRTIFSDNLRGVNYNFESLIWNNNSLDTILDHFIQDAIN